MKRNMLNYIIDIIMGISFLGSFATGILKFREILQFLASINIIVPTNSLTTIHRWCSLVMGTSALLHLILHWNWIVGTTKNILKRKRVSS